MLERLRAWFRMHGKVLFVALVIVAAQVAILRLEHRPYICACGIVKLWHGELRAPGNSQHLFDPFSFAHALHGFVFYALLRWTSRRRTTGQRVLLAMLLEVAWEIFENAQFLPGGMRYPARAGGYAGDSVVNSVGDLLSMLGGYGIALRWPTRWAAVAAIVFMILFFAGFRYGIPSSSAILLFPASWGG